RLFTFLDAGFESQGRAEALEALASSTPIVLDDLDKARPTEFAATHLQTAISVRVDDGLPLLVTTNRSLSEIAERYPEPSGEAIASRLFESCEQCWIEGADRRMERAV